MECEEIEVTIVEFKMGKEGKGMDRKLKHCDKSALGLKKEENDVEDVIVAEYIVNTVMVSDIEKSDEYGKDRG